MSGILEQLRGLSAAEEFFTLLDVPYDPRIINVSRLHILKRFQQYLKQDGVEALAEDSRKAACAASLKKAHDDFAATSGVDEKLFKVFKDQQAPAPGFISLDALKTRQG
ncbi:Nitrogenase-stabilizing/protective protein nifW [Magnetospirillum gryphiswaldense MSR-1 v2]|jgi:nitrogenase-stabilizing/protective protein|uniref:Nitrogenase-stabilizing/protective protein NifW n=1 Tax=Magnetospirillum gryphiswaldense (strain DSM 6361 / JCM 21280 / NBRC 15271 / MSR-1) TaxID=431944 RepID=V6EZC1_MAGGM|nr:nitrogenase stabilizing/protective protein NifW [Magnetospirillum gryphiswaldense]CDK97578.1 Nitrogenase-stabilizing/protective protein nifW [Magnetospirillum gryphiswaldense MSR-1 v2]